MAAADKRKTGNRKSSAIVPNRAATRTDATAIDQVATKETRARQQVIETALAMSRSRLSPGRSGNVSCRWRRVEAVGASGNADRLTGPGMLITPSGLAYDDLRPSDIVFVDEAGAFDTGARKPSSEWRFHLAAYRARADRDAIVHTHSLHATVLACAHLPIPAFHYMVAAAGGIDIPLVPYATFGTEALSNHVAAGLKQRDACLMANHGQIAIGRTLSAALELAQDVEVLAEQYIKVLQLGAVHKLDDAEMGRVLERFKSYGQRAQTAADPS